MRRTGTALVVSVTLVLAGCGQGRVEKGVSGGAIGAGAGAVVADYIGRDPLLGALLGGVSGAALGVRLGRDDRRSSNRKRKHRKKRYRDYEDDD
ncbi:MAG: cell envelope biogenesis protein OmpA [Pseudomonadota bacterium]